VSNSSEADPYPSAALFIGLPLAQATNSIDSTALALNQPIAIANNSLLWILVIALVTLIALLRSARTAVFSLNEDDRNYLDKKYPSFAKQINQYVANNEKFALTIRWASDILSSIALIVLYLCLNSAIKQWQYHQIIAAIAATTLIALAGFILEFLFSSLAVYKSSTFARLMAMPIAIIYTILSPIAQLWGTRYKLSPPVAPATDHDVFNHRDMETETNFDNQNDNNKIENSNYNSNRAKEGMAKFKNLSVKQIMCNRIDIYAIDINTDFKTICTKVIEWGYSRVPVYEEDIDQIIGVLYTKELLRYLEDTDNFDWKKLIKPAYFVPQIKKVSELLKEMQQNRVHLAVAVDEFGSTAGLITLEDILEEIVGDIRDEYDEDDMAFKRLDLHQYIFNGRTPLSDMCRAMRINPDIFDKVRGEAESLGGLLIELAGKFPDENETISHENFFFTVLTRRSNRIDEVKVTLIPIETTA
jgi:putative hemolysin